MATFDGWEEQLFGSYPRLGESCLAHSRTKGSKNGVRRYQTASGEWTPLGLQRRKEREGWGDGRRAARKAERAAAKNAKRKAYEERKAQAQESKRKNNLKTMTDEELKAKIARLKMEQEYKSLKKSPVLEAGKRAFEAYMNLKTKAEERRNAEEERHLTREKLKLERERVKADLEKAKENTKRAQADAEKAGYDAERMKEDVKGGLRIQRETELKRAKIDWKNTTLHGGITRRINALLTAGVSEKMKAKRVAEGQIEANRILSEGKWKQKHVDEDRKRSDDQKAQAERKKVARDYEKRQTQLRQERVKTQEDYAARIKKMQAESEASRKRMEALEKQRRDRQLAEQKRRQEEEERRRKKNEKKLQREFNKEIRDYDNTFHKVLGWKK